VRVWTKREDFWGVKESLTSEIKQSLDAAGIGIPFPQMDVHVEGSLSRPETSQA
jgi:small conductance mechanosensitive channel